jgi:leucyl-tRNA synthetase
MEVRCRYDPLAIEPAIAQRWHDERTYSLRPGPPSADRATLDATPFYALTMFPYPSGDLHMGHAEIFTIHDALVRHLRMTGKRCSTRSGGTRSGCRRRTPPATAAPTRRRGPTPTSRSSAPRSCGSGYSFDWDTVLHTCDPEYYRWTQWLFLELFDAGPRLPPRGAGQLGPVLPDGARQRAGRRRPLRALRREVERVPRTQWFFRITDYADELLDDLDDIDWPERVKNAQRNWIGRSEGAEITFRTADGADEVVVYTTRPDTIFGATYFVFAPEHPLVAERMADDADYDAFLDEVSRRSESSGSRRGDGQAAKRAA